MKKIREKAEFILGKTFPRAIKRASDSRLIANYNEPRWIGLSVQSMEFNLDTEGQCSSINLVAENNGYPIEIDSTFNQFVQFDYENNKLRIHEISISSVADLKKVLRNHCC